MRSWVERHFLLTVFGAVAVVILGALVAGAIAFDASGGAAGADSRYAASVRQAAHGQDAQKTDALLIAMADSACKALESGRTTLSQLTDELTAEGNGPDLAGAVVMNAERDFCPNWTGR